MTTPTKRARARAAERATRAVAAVKDEYRTKLERLKSAFVPPLSNAELSDALGLGSRHPSPVGRFVSTADRLRNARPNTELRALVDAILDGELLIAVQSGVPGAKRATLVCAPADVARLERAWQVRSMVTGPVHRDSETPAQWDDAFAWDTFGGGRSASAGRDLGGTRWIGPYEVSPLGLGAMRLSTTDLERERARDVLVTALRLGVRFIDTADSYCLDQSGVGANERLIASVLDELGLRDEVLVATKAGLTRPQGRWIPDGRPEHLTAAVEASLVALGSEAVSLLQLHVVDPKVPLADSLGALVKLREAGKIREIGVCNVSFEQAREALELAQIISVQNPVSFSAPGTARAEGFVRWCHEQGVALIAHSPLGGHRRVGALRRNARLRAVAADGPPETIALRWLLGLGPGVIPIPGATRRESVEACIKAAAMALSETETARLDADHDWAPGVREAAWARRATSSTGSVLVMGVPAAGKTTFVEPLVRRGYRRFNRDLAGGTLAAITGEVQQFLHDGGRRLVADNTYPTRRSRGEMVRAAEAYGLSTACIWLQTSIDDALFNACWRMLERCGHLLSPDEVKEASKHDPNLFPPAAVFRYEQLFEVPTLDEGFESIHATPFERRFGDEHVNKALVVDYDGTLRATKSGAPYPRSPEDIEILPRRREILERYASDGFLLLGVSNQAGIARGDVDAAMVEACFQRTNELLGHDIDVRYSPHAAGSWCRKPMPGLGVNLIRDYALNPTDCIMIGDMESDRVFARICGFTYANHSQFFA